jgi:hypothetical protein
MELSKQPETVATITLKRLSDGALACEYKLPCGPYQAIGMLEEAKAFIPQHLIAQAQQERARGVQLANGLPPGLLGR